MKLNISNKSGQVVKAPKGSNEMKPKVVKGGDLRSR